MLLDTWHYMTHIFWSWQIRDPFWRVKAGLKKEHQKSHYRTLFSALLEEKPPSNRALTASVQTHCPGATEGRSYFTSPFTSIFLLYSAFFFLQDFLQAQPPADWSDWCNSISFIFYFIISFCDFTNPATAAVLLSQPILLNMRWSKCSCTPSPLTLHHSIHHLTSLWVKWSISTCWTQQPSQEWLKSLSKENVHATIYFSKVYLGRKKKHPNFLGKGVNSNNNKLKRAELKMQDLKWHKTKSEQLEVNEVGNLSVARKKQKKKTKLWWCN